jgi:hypothetical protein
LNVAFSRTNSVKLTAEQKGRYIAGVPEKNDPRRCPNGHVLWKLYYKQIGPEGDTILCCHDCDGE